MRNCQMLTGCPCRVSLSGTLSVFARVRINKKGKTTVRPVCPTPKEFVHFQHCQPLLSFWFWQLCLWKSVLYDNEVAFLVSKALLNVSKAPLIVSKVALYESKVALQDRLACCNKFVQGIPWRLKQYFTCLKCWNTLGTGCAGRAGIILFFHKYMWVRVKAWKYWLMTGWTLKNSCSM